MPGRSSTRKPQFAMPTTRSRRRTSFSAGAIRSRPVESSPHHGHVSIQSLTPRAQRGHVPSNIAVLVPVLRLAAPRAERHRVLHAATAPVIAPRVEPKPPRLLDRELARHALLEDVHAAPRAEAGPVRHEPAARRALGAGDAGDVAPHLRARTDRAEPPEPLQCVTAHAAGLRARAIRHPGPSLRRRCAG